MLNIALDGYSGAGKSTIADEISKRLNIKKFNTGAIYRALACEYLAQNLPEPTQAIIENFIKDVKVEVFFREGKQYVIVNGHDYTDDLRKEEIGLYSSLISPYPVLREKVLFLQRDFALKNDCIMEGRDIGSVVLPNAKFKFFLTASCEVRAERRVKQLEEMGIKADYQEILREMKERDNNDLTRKVAPLVKVEDAIEIDSTSLSINEVVDKCVKIIKQEN